MSPETDVGYEAITLDLDSEVIDLMESRGILANEVKMVIHEAQSSGVKLYEPDSDLCLAKKRIPDVTYFVGYRPAGDPTYQATTTYCCKSEIVED